ncbi:TPA: hypothetical protein DEB00_02475 [Candidatus Uhrbacteria bacterium]|nr:hypothetical protein [Candidatus Uhrbacteria bacterium]
MSAEHVDGELEEARKVLEAALVRAAVAERVYVATAFTKLVDVAQDRAEECGRLRLALDRATTDSVTGLLRTDDWRVQLASALRRVLDDASILPILNGTLPLATARRVGLSDAHTSVVLATFDVRALGYVNHSLGYAAGSQMLALCAHTAATVLDEFLGPRGMTRRARVQDPMDRCSLTRTGGDEFRAVLVGQASTHWRLIRDGLLVRLGEEAVPGLDIPPAMAVGAMSMHILLWYLGAFYRWLKMPLPENKETMVTQAIQLWCAFTELRADAQRVVEYGLLFAQEWNNDPAHRGRFESWLTSKLRASAFSGREEPEIRRLCKQASTSLRKGKKEEAIATFEHDRDERMRVHLNVLLAKARILREPNVELLMQIFAISNEYEFAIP